MHRDTPFRKRDAVLCGQLQTCLLPDKCSILLRRLNIEGETYLMHIELLGALVFPASNNVKLLFDDCPSLSDSLRVDFGELCPSLQNIISTIETLSLTVHRSPWSCDVALRPMRSGLLEAKWDTAQPVATVLKDAPFGHLSFTSLHHLHLTSISLPLEEAQWFDILVRVPTLTTLEIDVRSSMLSSLLIVLQQTTSEGERVSPRLEKLVVLSRVDPAHLESFITCFSSTLWRAAPLNSLELCIRAEPEDLFQTYLKQLPELAQNVIIHYDVYAAPAPDTLQHSSTT